MLVYHIQIDTILIAWKLASINVSKKSQMFYLVIEKFHYKMASIVYL